MELGDQGVASEELEKLIQRGIAYLKPLVNEDGGIPNHSPGDPSGAWTTAEVLSTLWQLDPFLDSQWFNWLASYLLDYARLPDGSWPTANMLPGSIPGTAAGIQALLCIDKFPWLEQHRRQQVWNAIDKAVEWLITCRNKRWGWGWGWDDTNQPNMERPLSLTVFALRALAAYHDRTASGSIGELLWDGVRYLEWCQNLNGGWGLTPGRPSVISNTGRILKMLVSLGIDPNSRQILNGIDWLEQAAQKSENLRIIEEYVDVGDSYLPVDIHHNTPLILLSALLTLRPGSPMIMRLTRWFADSQHPNGAWELSSPFSAKKYSPSTWVTVEAISALQKVRTLQGSDSGSFHAIA